AGGGRAGGGGGMAKRARAYTDLLAPAALEALFRCDARPKLTPAAISPGREDTDAEQRQGDHRTRRRRAAPSRFGRHTVERRLALGIDIADALAGTAIHASLAQVARRSLGVHGRVRVERLRRGAARIARIKNWIRGVVQPEGVAEFVRGSVLDVRHHAVVISRALTCPR